MPTRWCGRSSGPQLCAPQRCASGFWPTRLWASYTPQAQFRALISPQVFWKESGSHSLCIRMPVSTALLPGVSGSPSGLRQQTQVFASQALGFWLPDGGLGSNLTSDILVFHSCHIQILQPLKLNHNLLFRQRPWNLSFLPLTTPTSPFFTNVD